MWTAKFWKSAIEKIVTVAVTTFSGTLAGTAVAADVNWDVVGWSTLAAALAALALALGAQGKGDDPHTANFVS